MESIAKGAIGFGVLAWASLGGLAPLLGVFPTDEGMQAAGGLGAILGAVLGSRTKG